jgi:serine/threonine-protein kinase HipA
VSLDVYLYGVRIGQLQPSGGGDYQLAYAAELLEGFGEGGAVLSNSLPGTDEPYSPGATRAYVEGMLPAGARREKIAAELGIDPGDGYRLIAALGRDCPGGVTFLPEGESEGADDGAEPPARLSDGELEELLAAEPERLFDPEREERMRFALGGLRHKLSLVREGSGGRWAWPGHHTPSTHILKPENGQYPDLVANEMFCTSVARLVGLWVAPTAVERIAGRRCLVSARFDRGTEDGQTSRFHQETFAQALGFAPGPRAGGAEAEGPDFAESSGLLRATSDEAEDSVTVLLAFAVLNHIVGNGDAHGENFGLLFAFEGPMLAPVCDITSTAVYGDPLHTGMTIAADHSEAVSMGDLAVVAEECGVTIDHCRNVAGNMAERISGALRPVFERAKSEGWDAPVIEDIVQLAAERSLALSEEVQS